MILILALLRSLICKNSYHSVAEVTEVLLSIHEKCPEITQLVQMGNLSTSVENSGIIFGTELWLPHKSLTPNFRYLGAIHGDERVGVELLLNLCQYLCDTYKTDDPEIIKLLQSTRIHIFPIVNFYGVRKSSQNPTEGRKNFFGRDINRNFPATNFSVANFLPDQIDERDEEVRDIITYITNENTPFVLSASFHGGARVVVTPYDQNPNGIDVKTPTPDWKVFDYVASQYADFVNGTDKYAGCPDEREFTNGVVNGAEWYHMLGGFSDFVYTYTNGYELIIEVSCEKFPSPSTLDDFWDRNKQAMINFIWQTHLGIKGTVRDTNGQPLQGIAVKVTDMSEGKYINHDIFTNKWGEYYRLLAPGSYSVFITDPKYKSSFKMVSVESQESCGGCPSQIVDFDLEAN